MALSGTFYGSTGNQYIDTKIVWSATQSVSGNYSDVTATLYYRRNNTGYTTYGTWSGSITINGTKKNSTSTLSIGTSWVKAVSNTVKVSHNSNGTKSITISASGSISGTSLSSTSISDTITLNTIPRASTITSAANVTLGNKCSIKWTPKASGFAYKLKFVCGNTSYTTSVIAPSTTSAYTYSGYTMTVDNWAGAISKYSATCTVTLYTYNSSSADTLIGSDSTTFTLTLSSSEKPTISLTTTLVNGWNNMYIQGKSKCTLTATFSPSTGSTIKSYSIAGDGFSKSGSASSAKDLSGTTSILSTDGTIKYTAKVTDGRTTVSTSKSITVWPYKAPTVSIKVVRDKTDGSKVSIEYNTSWSSLNNKNTIVEIQIFSKEISSSSYGSTPIHTSTSVSANDTILISGLDPNITYDFKAVVKDSYGTSNDSGSIGVGSSFRIFNINSEKDGIAFGKMSEDSSFECALKLGLLTPQHSGEAPGIYCRWADGKNHDILVRGADNLTTGLGWVGNDDNITVLDLRPRKVNVRGTLTAPRGRFTSTTDATGDAQNHVALRVGNPDGVHIDMDGNEIIAKTDATTLGEFLISGEHIDLYAKGVNTLKVGEDNTSTYIKSLPTYDRTYSSSPNMYITSNGVFGRGTSSSKRYKTDIENVFDKTLDPYQILKIPVKQYKYNVDNIPVDKHPDDLYIGLIAEDVADIYPIAAEYNEDGQAEMWNIKALFPALLKIVQDQQKEINTLKEQINNKAVNTK